MKDREIRERLLELEESRRLIVQEWKAYDQQYPVIPGAYKPPDYERQQIAFLDRLREVDKEIAALPRTKLEKLRLGLILTVAAGCAGWLIWFLFF